MPLPKPHRRQQQHKRAISCDAFLREDGLWDIEAHMTDIKSSSVDCSERGYVAAGDAFHDIWLRVTVDSTLKIQDVHISIDAAPFVVCPTITDSYKRLIGTRIGRGWRAAVKELVGGVAGCTHINELFPVIATTAFQSMWPFRDKAGQENGHVVMLDTCHAWARDGALAKQVFPQHTCEEQE